MSNKTLKIWKMFTSFNPASSLRGIQPVEVTDVHKDLCISIYLFVCFRERKREEGVEEERQKKRGGGMTHSIICPSVG